MYLECLQCLYIQVQLTDKINVYEVADSELDELKYVMQVSSEFRIQCL